VKECAQRVEPWRDPISWRDRIPREARIHQNIDENRPDVGGFGHDNLIKHPGYRLMMMHRRYRIYLNYYDGGDLLHAEGPHFERFPHPHEHPGGIPEVFIWHVFSSLVAACQVLHIGEVDRVPEAKVRPGWQSITHLDIKLNNIFLQPQPRLEWPRSSDLSQINSDVRQVNSIAKLLG
jgi:serine/threonine protein kinase